MMPRLLSQYASPALYQHVRDLGSQADPEAMANAMLMIGARPDASALLPTIHVPSLVIGATDDPIIPISESEAVRRSPAKHTMRDFAPMWSSQQPRIPTSFTAVLQSWLQRIK
jgi:pimeloyl-ACP methyl ester carboxylesterase